MGFREGEGLGKYGQGRKDIVEASNQKGRRGLGLTLKGFDGELNIDWQDEPEVSTLCFKSHFSCCLQQKLGEKPTLYAFFLGSLFSSVSKLYFEY